MKFEAKDTLEEKEIQKGLRSVIKDGLATQTMGTLTGGVFLVAFALKLGASNLVIGLLAAIPPLAQLMQLPAIYLVEKYKIRKAICVYASALSRIFWLFIAMIPFLFSPKAGLSFLLLAILLNSAFAAISSVSWNSWMRDLVPLDQLGAFFSKRMRLNVALGIFFSLAVGIYIDYLRKLFPNYELYGYSILFSLGFFAGMLGVHFISTIPEPRLPSAEEKPKFFKLLLLPFRDANFKNLIIFSGAWNSAVNLAAPFFTVYMLKRLQ